MIESVLSLCEIDPKDLVTESFALGPQRVHVLRHAPSGTSASDRVRDGEPLTETLRGELLDQLAIEVLAATMTESKWDRCPEAKPMLKFLEQRAGRRKLRLFACAMCRLSLHLLVGLDGESLLREAETAAEDGGNGATIRLPTEELRAYAARHSINERGSEAQRGEVEASALLVRCRDTVAPISQTEWLAAWHNAMFASQPFRWADPNAREGGPADQVAALRCIFGNPFRSVTFSLEWRTGTVRSLAQQMYESRDFSMMPILADALQDAGCNSDDLLDHCRDATTAHVRGCWVVDLVLGRE